MLNAEWVSVDSTLALLKCLPHIKVSILAGKLTAQEYAVLRGWPCFVPTSHSVFHSAFTCIDHLHSRFRSQPDAAVQLESSTIKDDLIYCRFQRDKLTTVQGRTYDLVNTPYHILVVAGRDLKSTYHKRNERRIVARM